MIASRRNFIAWIVLCAVVGAAATLYLAVGHAASHGATLILPLDDVYIHFQYARMIAAGQPFHYNPGDPPTSGATSLLYPFLLAAGYAIGFQGDRLALWAVFIGGLCWIGSTWLVFKLITAADPVRPGALTASARPSDRPSATFWVGLFFGVAFALNGGLSWAFMSGMETGLLVFTMLLTLWATVRDDRRLALGTAALTALIRPEGAVIALGAVLYFGLRRRATLPWALLPIAAIGVQPAINLALTGSLAATGMQAKSYLYNVPFDLPTLLRTVCQGVLTIGAEQIAPLHMGVWYGLGAALIGLPLLLALVWREGRRLPLESPHPKSLSPKARDLYPSMASPRLGGEGPGVRAFALVAFWLVGLSAIVALLETAFWQFKRYQQPLYALTFVVFGWTVLRLVRRDRRRLVGVIGVGLLGANATLLPFVGYYFDNVNEVASLQVPLAHYVATHTPLGARIGVHDIGVMRYLGDRPTYDLVGLSTPDAARAWRSGPGAVYETLRRSPYRPDYFAVYDQPHGLSYFAGTDLFSPALARFPSTDPPYNVASAADSQIVAQPLWDVNDAASRPRWPPPAGFAAVDALNVADLQDEDSHGYRWSNRVQRDGYATELYQLPTLGCTPADAAPCHVIDGGRRITGSEALTIRTQPGQDLLWLTRVHPHDEAALTLFADDRQAAVRAVPGGLGGHWLEIATLIPGRLITGTQTRLRVEVAATDGAYMPYYHWFYQGHFVPNTAYTLPGPAAQFGGIALLGRRLTLDAAAHTLRVEAEWQVAPGAVVGDDKLFIHVYADGQTDRPPLTQIDQWPGQFGPSGPLPPANWLPGVFRETYSVPLPTAPGGYHIALGWYDTARADHARLPVTGDGATADGRLFIDRIAIGF